MKYIGILFLVYSCSFICMDTSQRKTGCKAQEEESALADQVIAKLNAALFACEQTEKIEEHLALLDTQAPSKKNILAIERMVVTARTAQELAQIGAHDYAKNTKPPFGPHSPFITYYVNAQLNYKTICNHFGIPPLP